MQHFHGLRQELFGVFNFSILYVVDGTNEGRAVRVPNTSAFGVPKFEFVNKMYRLCKRKKNATDTVRSRVIQRWPWAHVNRRIAPSRSSTTDDSAAQTAWKFSKLSNGRTGFIVSTDVNTLICFFLFLSAARVSFFRHDFFGLLVITFHVPYSFLRKYILYII